MHQGYVDEVDRTNNSHFTSLCTTFVASRGNFEGGALTRFNGAIIDERGGLNRWSYQTKPPDSHHGCMSSKGPSLTLVLILVQRGGDISDDNGGETGVRLLEQWCRVSVLVTALFLQDPLHRYIASTSLRIHLDASTRNYWDDPARQHSVLIPFRRLTCTRNFDVPSR